MLKLKIEKKICTLLLLLVFLSGCTTSGENVHILEGDKYLTNFSYSLALEQYKQAINDDPTLSSAYLQAGGILIAKGNYPDAESLLLQGSNFARDKEKIWQKLGELYFTEQKYPDALGYFNKTLEVDRNNQSAVLGKINSLILTGAEKELGEYVIALNDNELSQENQMIKAILLLDDPEVAQASLTAAAKGSDNGLIKLAEKFTGLIKSLANPDDKLFSLAQIAYETMARHWYTESIPIADLMISQNEYYEGGFIYKGSAYLQLGNYAGAEENLAKALTYNPGINDTKILLAQAKFGLKKNAEAKTLLGQVKEPLSNLSEDKFTSICKILYQYGEYQTIQEYYTAYARLKEITNPQLLLTELRTLSLLNLFTDTQTLSVKLLTMKEQFNSKEIAEIYAKQGNALFNLGDKAKGLDILNIAKATDQTLAETQYYLGVLYIDQKDTATAKSALEKAQDLDFSGDISNKAGELLKTMQ